MFGLELPGAQLMAVPRGLQLRAQLPNHFGSALRLLASFLGSSLSLVPASFVPS